MADEHRDQIRIVQETVAGKEITFAHIMGGPAPIIYQKLGLNPQVDYGSSAIGIMNMTPSESAVIPSDTTTTAHTTSFSTCIVNKCPLLRYFVIMSTEGSAISSNSMKASLFSVISSITMSCGYFI